MQVFRKLPDEIKNYIISFLDKECFRCSKPILYLKKDKYYHFYPPFLNADENFEGFVVCPLCLFSLQMVSRFTNKGIISYG